MADLIIILGEGPTETSFFEGLLIKNGFTTSDKRSGVFVKNGNIVLVSPCMNMPKTTGKNSLLKTKKYKTFPAIALSAPKSYGLAIDNYRLIIGFDTEDPKADFVNTQKTIHASAHNCFGCVGETIVLPVKGSIENWFVAGLTDKYSDVKASKKRDFDSFVNHLKPDEIPSLKNRFYDCLNDPMAITLNAISIGSQFDIDLAKSLSPSFSDYIDALRKTKDLL